MKPVLGTTSKYALSTFHLAGLPSLCCHLERSLPSKRTIASEGGRPGISGVLVVPGSMTGGTGRLGSWICHLGSTWVWAKVATVKTESDKNRMAAVFFICTPPYESFLADRAQL